MHSVDRSKNQIEISMNFFLDDARFPKAMRIESLALVPLVSLSSLANIMLYGAEELVVPYAVMFLLSAFIARFLHQRAKGLEASLFGIRIVPGVNDDSSYSVERVICIAGALVFLVCAFGPTLRKLG
jgi:hypothetical protein